MKRNTVIAGVGLLALAAFAAFRSQEAYGYVDDSGNYVPPDTSPPTDIPPTFTPDVDVSNPATQPDAQTYMDPSQNLTAFLAMIRRAEVGTSGEEGYTTLYCAGKCGVQGSFTSFADHPRIAIKSPYGWTSAAGAYQAMARSPIPGTDRFTTVDTWGDFIRARGPHDFSPRSQDEFAQWALARRNALEDIAAGRFAIALQKASREWASLGPYYQQQYRTPQELQAFYIDAGGTVA